MGNSYRNDVSETKSIFIHDVNNPLSGLISYPQLIAMRNTSKIDTNITSPIAIKAQYIQSITETLRQTPFPDAKLTQEDESNEEIIGFYENMIRESSKKIYTCSDGIKKYCMSVRPIVEDKKTLDRIIATSQRISDIASMTAIGIISRENIEKTSSYVNALNVARNLIKFYSENEKVQDEGIKTELWYNEAPIIHTNKDVINGIMNALLANAYEYAPKQTNVRMGLKNEEETLEIIVENYTDKKSQRSSFGLSKGNGIHFVKKVLREMDGKYSYQDKRQTYGYDELELFGKEGKSLHPEKLKIYSAKITLPIKTKQREAA